MNTFAKSYGYTITLILRVKTHLLFDSWKALICTTLSVLYLTMLCDKYGWIWPNGFGGDFKMSSMYFCYFVIISRWERAKLLIWTNLIFLYPRMLCANFGWNWPSGSSEEDENVKSFQTDRSRRTTGDQNSSRPHSSGELKTRMISIIIKDVVWSDFKNLINGILTNRIQKTDPPWKRRKPCYLYCLVDTE